MRLFIEKAISPSRPARPQGPKPSTKAGGGPSISGPKTAGPKVEYDYWSGSGNPPTNGGWEQTKSGGWRRPKGQGSSGSSKKEQAKSPQSKRGGGNAASRIARAAKEKKAVSTNQVPDSTTASPKSSVDNIAEATTQPLDVGGAPTLQSAPRKDPRAVAGTFSINAEDYPEDSKPLDHYRIAQFHDKNSFQQGSEGHKAIAKKRAEKLSPEEHGLLADDLDKMGLAEDAAYHREKSSKSTDKSPESEPSSEEPKAETAGEESVSSGKEGEPSTNASEDTEPTTFDEALNKWKKESAEVESFNKKANDTYRENLKKYQEHLSNLKEHEKKKPEKPVPPGAAPGPSASESEVSSWKSEKRKHMNATADYRRAMVEWANEKKKIENSGPDAPQPPSLRDGSLKAKPKAPKKSDFLEPEPQSQNVPSQGAEEAEQSQEQQSSDESAEQEPSTPDEDEQIQSTNEELTEGEDAEAPERRSSGSRSNSRNFLQGFESGKQAGNAAASAASTEEGAGSLGVQTLNYLGAGVARTGHKLLSTEKEESKPNEKDPVEASRRKSKAPKQSKPEQTVDGVQKHMRLVLDLRKAGPTPTPSGGASSKEVDRSSEKVKQTPGVSGGSGQLSPDTKEVGRSWKTPPLPDEPETDEGIDGDLVSKSLEDLNNFTDSVYCLRKAVLPYSDTEVEYMTQVLGYSFNDIVKGFSTLSRRDRQNYYTWLNERLVSSLNDLKKSL